MPPPRVSALIVSRERPDLLRACLRSVGAQDFTARETIVLANGCAATAGLVRAEFPDVRLIEEAENLGCPGGRNRIAEEARGEFLLFLDDDGELRDPTSLGRLVEQLAAQPRLAVVTTALLDAVADEPTGWRLRQSGLTTACLHFSFAGGASLLRAAAFRAAGGYLRGSIGPGEEYDLAVRLYHRGDAILHFPDVVFHHRVDKTEDDWMAELHRGYAHLQRTIWRLYPAPWHLLGSLKALFTALYVDCRLGGGRRLGAVLRDGWAMARVGASLRRPVSREGLRRLYYAKYHFLTQCVALDAAPRTTLWRLPVWRLRRRFGGQAKIERLR